ncbi:MAG: hypothetical protein WA982_13295 [Rubrobacteraceae bacterium]
MTKILTKTVPPPVAINGARAHQGRGRFGFIAVHSSPQQSVPEPVE